MAQPKTTTDRFKVNPPLGRMVMLQFVLPNELQVDDSYQRSIETGESQALIRRIARYWDWDLCQPLVVSRRRDGTLFVIDGQHRLAAARLRGDIAQLPAMVKEYSSAADEAATFVQMNQQRRPLTPLQVFHAAVASGDSEACAIQAAVTAAGLRLTRSSQLETAPPGTINNVGGLQRSWRRRGGAITALALKVLAAAFPGEKLMYGGSIFPGIVAVCFDETKHGGPFLPARADAFAAALRRTGQLALRSAILQAKASTPGLNYADAAAEAVRAVWRGPKSVGSAVAAKPAAAAVQPPQGVGGWCDQCDMKVSAAVAATCKSRFCKMKVAA